ncbi:MAG: phosphoribosylanthranilate isomerase [Deinococcus sp.]|nr:phosphoribosylanthranilate isomerase [Deinococcus sp.]
MRVKICGITSARDALAAQAAGADAIGLVFAGWKRRVDLAQAASLARATSPFLTRVGVFQGHSLGFIQRAITWARLGAVQLHGIVPPELITALQPWVPVIQAFAVDQQFDPAGVLRSPADAILLDAPQSGSGQAFSWERAAPLAGHPRLVVAGGLTVDNVQDVVRHLRPLAVDVSSGVESAPGVKDHQLVAEFIRRAKEAACSPI